MDGDRRELLVARLLEHLGEVCVTGDEGPIADTVAGWAADLGEPVQRVGHSLVIGAPGDDPSRELVLLVGHLDVVPPTDEDRVARREERTDGEVVVGRGASDMKSGNVLAMTAFEDPALRAASPYDLVLVLYAGEEGPADGNELRDVLAAVPWLRSAALAVVLEPTDGEVQLGCLGGLHATVTFHGIQAHSARPWHGRNAITMAGPLLAELAQDAVREVEVDGIPYRDVWSVTHAYSAGFGPMEDPDAQPPPRNIIPGRFTLNLNLRFAPSRGLDDAAEELRARIGAGADVEVEIVDRAPPAPPGLDAPLLRRFVDTVAAPVAGKQAWTDVARFAEIGVPALNYGPGATAQAHQRGEWVAVDAVLDADQRLRRFLAGT